MEEYRVMIILIAEDDDGHAELIQEGLREAGVYNKILRFSNGEALWQFLISTAPSAREKNQGYLLLLDINMPRIDGVEILRRMKSDAVLKDIPVIMLTTTDDPREVEQCYQLGCSVYITKPIDFSKFAETLHRLGLFVQIVKI